MSQVYKTEEEQIDDLKRWIKSFGPSILIGIILAIALIYGWQAWRNYQHESATKASVLYQQAVEAFQTKDDELLDQSIAKLQEKYPNSPYTAYGLFIKAKVAVDKQNNTDAEKTLNSIIQYTKDNNIRSIAQLRLASIQITENQETLAIETLKDIKNPSFKPLALIKIGDAYTKMGDNKLAKSHYEEASKLLPDTENTMPILSMKLDHASTT